MVRITAPGHHLIENPSLATVDLTAGPSRVVATRSHSPEEADGDGSDRHSLRGLFSDDGDCNTSDGESPPLIKSEAKEETGLVNFPSGAQGSRLGCNKCAFILSLRLSGSLTDAGATVGPIIVVDDTMELCGEEEPHPDQPPHVDDISLPCEDDSCGDLSLNHVTLNDISLQAVIAGGEAQEGNDIE
ncbi:uncharacterized protein GIQ15_01651 [Arthroderma uncinatum]|uniref:uncharacterized protein n=1 Tax=Arthroderma uncinatum TaxID=74035 RepID=UPI00144AB6EE|nr:uncharacterized protein GIQ15_01651 [Arthroderma uncinatum]KAF3492134.1 hypothetical protein GIQ15_01651 [Arthroderma uncinatum]